MPEDKVGSFFLALFILSPSKREEVAQTAKVFLQYKTDTLGVERVACEIAVVGLVVDMYAEVAIGEYEIAQVEVADERCCSVGIVAITELPVEDQAVV